VIDAFGQELGDGVVALSHRHRQVVLGDFDVADRTLKLFEQAGSQLLLTLGQLRGMIVRNSLLTQEVVDDFQVVVDNDFFSVQLVVFTPSAEGIEVADS
jgi:hypothetical protein